MRTDVLVIVNLCEKTENGVYRIRPGSACASELFSTLEEAMPAGKEKIGKGKSVIVRLTYNERDEKGVFYREWRSFDGKDFEEVVFRV